MLPLRASIAGLGVGISWRPPARLQLAVVGDGCVCVTGDVRNDIYMTLMQGELRRGGAGKVTDKNVEVTIMVCSNDGEVIPVRVARFLHSPRKSMLKLY